jgi:hypothetical protein
LKQVNELETSKIEDSSKTINVVLKASNCKRQGKISYDSLNASISGAMIENISETPQYAKTYIDKLSVEQIIISLGTNDIAKCKNDTDRFNVSLTQAVKEIKTEFPMSDIAFCTVIPRKGKGQYIVKYYEITTSVNAFVKKIMC